MTYNRPALCRVRQALPGCGKGPRQLQAVRDRKTGVVLARLCRECLAKLGKGAAS